MYTYYIESCIRASITQIKKKSLEQTLERANIYGRLNHQVTSLCVLNKTLLSILFAYFMITLIILSSQCLASPPLDSDINWGRGGQLSLTNPALIRPRQGGLSVSYDLITPTLEALTPAKDNDQDTRAITTNWGHELYLSAGLGSYTVSGGYLRLQSLPLMSPAWSIAQSLILSDRLTTGLTLLNSDQGWRWLGGVSYGVTPWLNSNLTIRSFHRDILTHGDLTFGFGLKPISDVNMGINATPKRGGGRLGVSAQFGLWRGLALELGWSVRHHDLEDSADSFIDQYSLNDQTERGENLFRIALSWRGNSGWRAESGVKDHSSARLGVRLESRVHPAYSIETEEKIIVINARDTRERSYHQKLFSSARGFSPFFRLLETLDKLRSEKSLKAAVLILGGSLGPAQAEELIEAILKLRLEGTMVYAYLPQATLYEYLVAAACDVIWSSPTAEISISGLLSERFYLKGALERLKINPEFITVGDYKSAPEVFEREGPSKEAAAMDKRLLDARFSAVVNQLAHRAQQQRWAKEPSPSLTRGKRLISLKKLRDQEPADREDKARAITWLNQGPYSAKGALNAGLIDQSVSPTDLERTLKETHPSARFIHAPSIDRSYPWAPLPEIALIHASGEIGSGSGLLGSPNRSISASSYVPLIKRAAYNTSIKAVVLRIDSPGGAVTDADAMWVALKELATRKPLIVSMGNIAASGGYYIASPAHMIFANTNTLTGSIGVFAGKADLSSSLEELGINIHRQSRGKVVSRSLFTPWSTQARKRLTNELENIYELFLARIIEGRPLLNKEKLLPSAGGRVWTGEEARERGLIDTRGGLLDAIKWAQVRSGLAGQPHRVRSLFPQRPSALQKLLGFINVKTVAQSSLTTAGQHSLHDQLIHSPLTHSPLFKVATLFLRATFTSMPSHLRFALASMITEPGVVLAIDPR